MLDRDLVNRIRTIFLHQRPHVSIAEATVLLGWSRGEMSQAIGAGEVEVTSTSPREVALAGGVDGEGAGPLVAGSDRRGARGGCGGGVAGAVRLIDLHVRLPRHQVAMLEHFAERERTSISSVLARELDGVASAHANELSWAVAGFADALAWPDAEAAQLPC